MKIIAIADIVGEMGRKTLNKVLPEMKKKYKPDLVVANVENSAHGKGITEKTINQILMAGVDICTSGNHVWDKEEGIKVLEKKDTKVLRPANYPDGVPGIGHKLINVGKKKVLVINLQGQPGMRPDVDSPFRKFDQIMLEYSKFHIDAVLVDLHAEMTSEKVGFGWYSDGRAGVVWGTHTHVATADARILDKGTGYITDIGMTGPYDGILGVGRKEIIERFLTQIPQKHTMITNGKAIFSGIYAEVVRGKCKEFKRIEKIINI